MSFQDEIKSNFRTKEQAAQEQIEKRKKELMEKAEDIIDVVKINMLSASKKGEYAIVNGEKIITKYWYLPNVFMKRDVKKVPATIRRTLFGRVEIVESERYIATISIAPDQKEEYNFFMDYLISLAEKDGIKITRIVAGRCFTIFDNQPNQVEPIPFVEESIFPSAGDSWELYVEFSITVA